jgi:hypothetical protein
VLQKYSINAFISEYILSLQLLPAEAQVPISWREISLQKSSLGVFSSEYVSRKQSFISAKAQIPVSGTEMCAALVCCPARGENYSLAPKSVGRAGLVVSV